jgi:7-cyano-7-deazaguanine synthase in queuosine biosynthesis
MSVRLISFSGGLDSTTILARLAGSSNIQLVFFEYGSMAGEREWKAAKDISGYYDVPIAKYDVSSIFAYNSHTGIMKHGRLPIGKDDDVKLSIVPGRNLVFASVLASVAETKGGGTIFMGSRCIGAGGML